MKKIVIKKGDIVRIVKPIFVERVGYPLVWTMLVDEVENNPNLVQAAELLGIVAPPKVQTFNGVEFNIHSELTYKVKQEFVQGVCKALVRARNWGGKERSLHLEEKPHYQDCEGEVLDKRRAMTGTYYGPRWYGEDDYEPGGLSGMKAHTLLQTTYGLIEQCNVELVRKSTEG